MRSALQPAPVPVRSLSARALHAVGWSYVAGFIFLVSQVGYTAITARLVSPAAYGGYALALTIVGLAGLVGMVGMGDSVMRVPELTDRGARTALTLALGSGVLLSVALIALSGPIEYVLRTPGTGQMLRILAVQPPMIAAAGVSYGLLRRGQRYQAASLIDLTSSLIGFAVGAAATISGMGAAGLALGQVARGAVAMLVGLVWARVSLRPAFDRAMAREFTAFSAQVASQNLGHYAIGNLPLWSVARLAGGSGHGAVFPRLRARVAPRQPVQLRADAGSLPAVPGGERQQRPYPASADRSARRYQRCQRDRLRGVRSVRAAGRAYPARRTVVRSGGNNSNAVRVRGRQHLVFSTGIGGRGHALDADDLDHPGRFPRGHGRVAVPGIRGARGDRGSDGYRNRDRACVHAALGLAGWPAAHSGSLPRLRGTRRALRRYRRHTTACLPGGSQPLADSHARGARGRPHRARASAVAASPPDSRPPARAREAEWPPLPAPPSPSQASRPKRTGPESRTRNFWEVTA